MRIFKLCKLIKLKKLYFLFAGFLFCLNASGQHTPMITNYKASDYKAHNQNWSLTQCSNRMMFSANTYGLLSFDGNSWKLNKLKSNKLLRSVFAKGKRIYSGAFEEIGYWEENECGKMQFTDLTSKIDVNWLKNEEFWHITANEKYVFFQSFSVLLAYDGQKFRRIPVQGSIMFLQFIQGKGYFQALEHGIFVLDNKLNTRFLKNSGFFRNKIISGILPYQETNSLLITTHSDGIFIYNDGKITEWRADLNKYFQASQINKALVTHDQQIVLGTIRDGVLIFDKSRELQYHINTSNGIQNNTILALIEDQDKNIWIGLDKGISMIDMSQEFLQFRDISGQIGSVYTIAELDSVLYLGTNQGVYFHDMKRGVSTGSQLAFTLVEGSQGQVWQLLPLKNQLFCGHNEGSFLISNQKAIKISPVTGGWYNEFDSIKDGEKILLQGNYTGLCVFSYAGESIRFLHKVNGYSQPVKKFIADGQYLWVCNQNSGVKRLKLDENYKNVLEVISYDKKRGLSQKNNLDLVRFNDQIMVWDGETHFHYDQKKDIFVEDSSMRIYEKGFIIRSLDNKNWLRIYQDKAVRMFGQQEMEQIPLIFNRDYHNAVVLNTFQFAYCMDDGYIIQNRQERAMSKNSVQDSIQIRLHGKEGKCFLVIPGRHTKIPYSDNDVTVVFRDLDFRPGKTYRYRILPTSATWKLIDNNSKLELSNLRAGKYNLEIRRSDGTYGKINFEILPPWYLSHFTIFMYIIMAGAGIYLVNRYYTKKLKQTKAKMLSEQARLIKEHTMEIENQRLVSENLYKNKELANVTMHLIQKNEILSEIKGELTQLKYQADQKHLSREIQSILKQINQNLTLEEDKRLFDTSFDEVHETFLKTLKSKFPSLSQDDLKLAAFLRMNLTSKEIAPLFNISIRGMENKRYRLRKKLRLESDVNLTDYFNQIII